MIHAARGLHAASDGGARAITLPAAPVFSPRELERARPGSFRRGAVSLSVCVRGPLRVCDLRGRGWLWMARKCVITILVFSTDCEKCGAVVTPLVLQCNILKE